MICIALKKKHSKTGDDAKWQGTIFGKCTDNNEILVEGGPITSINEWISQRAPEISSPPRESQEEEQKQKQQQQQQNGDDDDDDDDDDKPLAADMRRTPSSGLSSVGDRLGDDIVEAMDLT